MSIPWIMNLLVGMIIMLEIVYSTEATNISLGVEISEIMYDPSVSDSGGEWLEIYNNTGSTLDITGWILDVGGADVETLEQRVGWGDISQIPAGAYAVISELASTVNFDDIYGPPSISIYVAVTGSAISLSNTPGERIVLKNSDESITYQDFTYPDNVTNGAMIKFVIFDDEDTESLWVAASTPEGTPGSIDTGADQTLPVTLSSFTATPTDFGVIIKWRTESEVNNLGWNIYRSEKKDGKFVKINARLILSASNSATPNYQFVDDTAVKGRQYYYYLEDVDISGQRNKSPIILISKRKAGKLAATWGGIKKGY